MKKLLLLICLSLCITSTYGQDIEEAKTKMDAFASKTGVILKFIDYSLPNLKLTYGVAETKIRKVISGNEADYFYIISHEGKYDTKTASIQHEDLLEVIKAIQTLKMESLSDRELNPDYLENKFVTEDGFKLGYYVKKGNVKWYIVLERYGTGNTIFINDVATIENSFNQAKAEIEARKN